MNDVKVISNQSIVAVILPFIHQNDALSEHKNRFVSSFVFVYVIRFVFRWVSFFLAKFCPNQKWACSFFSHCWCQPKWVWMRKKYGELMLICDVHTMRCGTVCCGVCDTMRPTTRSKISELNFSVFDFELALSCFCWRVASLTFSILDCVWCVCERARACVCLCICGWVYAFVCLLCHTISNWHSGRPHQIDCECLEYNTTTIE